ncbi:hypothetical protein CRG98_006779 [Punica granatum]|uniref:Alkaline/neutral invertase n=1 Tax=Punica granatum TaxID=22663 RepID=A0A2I0KWG6_PUNGR|nr:hypothetical protein CRG98_006779 [Punica granatum]
MSSSSSIGICTMKPSCRILISYKGSSIFGVSPHRTNPSVARNLSKSQFKSIYCRSYSSSQILGHKGSVGPSRRAFCVSDQGWSQYGSISSICCVHNLKGSKRGILVIPRIASDTRNQSTSVGAHVNEKGFERIYVQGGLNVKPLVIERIETGLGVVEEREDRVEDDNLSVHTESFTGLNERKDERELSEIEKEAWKLLRSAVVNYCGAPVGTVAANDPADKQPLNYDQVFIRDFIPSALAFLLKGEGEIVKNFLLHTLQLQEVLDPDFGESAIGRVAPVDSGLWWIILLRAYGKLTGDYSLQERVDVQTGMRLILNLCLSDGFDMFPSLLVTDGSCMIDRRMGIHGHPLEIQVS